jgi:hypothetical protein
MTAILMFKVIVLVLRHTLHNFDRKMLVRSVVNTQPRVDLIKLFGGLIYALFLKARSFIGM